MTDMFLDPLVHSERMDFMDGLTRPWVRVNNQLGVVPTKLRRHHTHSTAERRSGSG